MMKIQVDYQTEVTDADEYLQQYGQQELKIRSFASGSGFLTKPELALVGDAGSNNPEIVLNNPQLQALISEASKSGNEMLIRKMDQLINVVESLDFDVYLNSQTVTDEVNRENNRRKRRTNIS
ncbi:MAG: hypothetical protein M9949_10720 [Candidatus Kapabacteria bacterium]|nr:hypothetical protein [Candidatus Kapabacteria bacterium]